MSRLIDRFNEKYIPEPNSGCWLWEASTDGRYGMMHVAPNSKPKMEKAHRISYRIHLGEIPDGLSVRHKCDNTLCVNPSHLELGTHAENMRDMKDRGRAGPIKKLTDSDIQEIRCMEGTHRHIAEVFMIDESYVSRIRRNLVREG